jgi:anti-sigma regulatory factor (Ser/Thr protein kinase)
MNRPGPGRQRRSDAGASATILGSLTVPGERQEVSRARGFVTRTLAGAGLPEVDSDAATLLTSELVTNAILHTASGRPGGTVSVVILGLPGGALIEVADGGSAGMPVVKGDALAGEGQGHYLVQQMASQWGYRRDQAGTTVWFYLAAQDASPGSGPARPASGQQEGGQHDGRHHGGQPHRGARLPADQFSAGNQHPADNEFPVDNEFPADNQCYPGNQQWAAASTPAQIAARSSSLVV